MILPGEAKRKQRIKYLIAFAVLVLIEVLIAIYVHDAFIRPYVGDMLVVIVLYCLARVIIPEQCRWMPLWIFIFATVTEGLQYFKILRVLGVEDNTFLRILLGSTFDWKDIICYGMGCLLLGIYECFIRRNRKGASPLT